MTFADAVADWERRKNIHTAADVVRGATQAWISRKLTDDRFLEILAKVGLWANVEAAKRDQTAPFYVERMKK
jgi:hypothetical protein